LQWLINIIPKQKEMIKQIIVCTLMCALCSLATCQFSNTFGSSYGGTPGIGSSSSVVGGNYNNFGQNTQCYSNQIAASNYAPFSSFNSYSQTPALWGNSWGNSFASPWLGGCGGWGGVGWGGCGVGLGGWGGCSPYLGAGRIC